MTDIPLRNIRAKNRCPRCQNQITAGTSLDGDHEPVAGAVVVCMYCAGLLIFDGPDKALYTRMLTPAEFNLFDPETKLRIAATIQTIVGFKAKKKQS